MLYYSEQMLYVVLLLTNAFLIFLTEETSNEENKIDSKDKRSN